MKVWTLGFSIWLLVPCVWSGDHTSMRIVWINGHLSVLEKPSESEYGKVQAPWENRQIYPRYFWSRTMEVFFFQGGWDRRRWIDTGFVVASLGLVYTFDDDIRDLVQSNRSPASQSLGNFVDPFGEELSFAMLGAFALSNLFGSEKAGRVARDGLTASILAGGVVTPVLKEVFGRTRPIEALGADRFGVSGHRSFPSGHTTQAFAVAGVISAHHPQRWVKISSYGLATLVGLSRMEKDAHFATDVLAGSLIGFFISQRVVRGSGEGRLAPMIEPGRIGIRMRFPQR